MTSALATLLACAGQTVLYAQEPIIQTKYTADPAPMVYNDTVFLYTSHDEDDAQGYGFKMLDWQLYTSTDMVNWTDHGPIASLKDFTWRKRDNGAWALQVVERNGKFYMYCPLHGNGIGVLVSDSPYGPFKDPIGKPLVWQKEHWDDIDPTVYIDDDGQAYIYNGGGGTCKGGRLKDNMMELDGAMRTMEGLVDFHEATWIHKYNGVYYLSYSDNHEPGQEGVAGWNRMHYAISDHPLGPWKHMGIYMQPTRPETGVTNHGSIVQYKGQWFAFYHNSALSGDPWLRSVCVDRLYHNADGTIRMVEQR